MSVKMNTKYFIPVIAILLVISVSGCIEGFPSFKSLFGSTQSAVEQTPDIIITKDLRVIPTPPVTAEDQFTLYYTVKNQDPTQSIDDVNVKLYNWGICSPVPSLFLPETDQWTTDSETSPAYYQRTFSQLVNNEEKVIEWVFDAPTNNKIGNMQADCPIKWEVSYTFSSRSQDDFTTISKLKKNEMDRAGQTWSGTDQPQYVGIGPIKIYYEFKTPMPVQSNSSIQFAIKVIDKGVGIYPKIEANSMFIKVPKEWASHVDLPGDSCTTGFKLLEVTSTTGLTEGTDYMKFKKEVKVPGPTGSMTANAIVNLAGALPPTDATDTVCKITIGETICYNNDDIAVNPASYNAQNCGVTELNKVEHCAKYLTCVKAATGFMPAGICCPSAKPVYDETNGKCCATGYEYDAQTGMCEELAQEETPTEEVAAAYSNAPMNPDPDSGILLNNANPTITFDVIAIDGIELQSIKLAAISGTVDNALHITITNKADSTDRHFGGYGLAKNADGTVKVGEQVINLHNSFAFEAGKTYTIKIERESLFAFVSGEVKFFSGNNGKIFYGLYGEVLSETQSETPAETEEEETGTAEPEETGTTTQIVDAFAKIEDGYLIYVNANAINLHQRETSEIICRFKAPDLDDPNGDGDKSDSIPEKSFFLTANITDYTYKLTAEKSVHITPSV